MHMYVKYITIFVWQEVIKAQSPGLPGCCYQGHSNTFTPNFLPHDVSSVKFSVTKLHYNE